MDRFSFRSNDILTANLNAKYSNSKSYLGLLFHVTKGAGFCCSIKFFCAAVEWKKMLVIGLPLPESTVFLIWFPPSLPRPKVDLQFRGQVNGNTWGLVCCEICHCLQIQSLITSLISIISPRILLPFITCSFCLHTKKGLLQTWDSIKIKNVKSKSEDQISYSGLTKHNFGGGEEVGDLALLWKLSDLLQLRLLIVSRLTIAEESMGDNLPAENRNHVALMHICSCTVKCLFAKLPEVACREMYEVHIFSVCCKSWVSCINHDVSLVLKKTTIIFSPCILLQIKAVYTYIYDISNMIYLT